MITLVTTFNKSLYSSYAYRLIESFKKYAANDCNLLIIYEGDPQELKTIENNKITLKPFSSEAHKKFVQYFGKLNEARGYKITKITTAYLGNQLTVIQDFRFDAIRFSFKIFSIIQGIEYVEKKTNYVWIDADVVCLKEFSEKNLLKFLPDNNQLMSYLGRNQFPLPNPYSECGYLGFNLSHPSLGEFLERMKSLYVTGEIFTHVEWHDSWLWDQIRFEYENKGIEFKNLTKNILDTDHPFINCGLGEYFDHLKGPSRKVLGKSFNEDYKR